jgi:flagellar FliJ protein
MKKFKFALDTVLNYSNLVLEEKKREHAAAIAAVTEVENQISQRENDFNECKENFNREKANGILVMDAMSYQTHLHTLQDEIKKLYEQLEKLKEKEAIKREAVVKAKTESLTLDKLKEKKLVEYAKLDRMEQERFIEEFVSNKTAAQ